jgi:hypothetical protein
MANSTPITSASTAGTRNMNQMEKDVYRQCSNKLRQWARDSVQLHEIAGIDVPSGFRNMIWLLLSLAIHICVHVKLSKELVLSTMSHMYDEEMNDVNRNQSEGYE